MNSKGYKKQSAIKSFFDGMTSFVAFPGWKPDALEDFRAARRAQPGIPCYFGIIGHRISTVCDHYEEPRVSVEVEK